MTSLNMKPSKYKPGGNGTSVLIPDAEVTTSGSQSNGKSLLGGRNQTMERESKGCLSVLFYMTVYINLDVWKQVTTYGIKYYNGGVYPVPQTFVVTVTELAKLAIFLVIAAREGTLSKVKLSVMYAVPSLIYAVNNNIYFYALHYTTPPIWNIIIQIRILVAAVAYRVVFKKVITPVQWVALGLLITAIVMTSFAAGDVSGMMNSDLTIPMILALMGSVTSTTASFVMEYLFKNDKRNFSEMQIQLYLFGSLACGVLYGMETQTQSTDTTVGGTQWVWFLLAGCVVMSTLVGVTVAVIVKRLDNIVKLYTQALANMMTSIACTYFFPEDFQLSLYFLGCLSLMMFAIFLYESKEIPYAIFLDGLCKRVSSIGVERLALFVILTLIGVSFLFAVA